MKYLVRHSVILFGLLILVGCASSGVIKDASPISTSTPGLFDFVLVESSSSLDNLDPEKRSLNDMIISGLRETELFESVSGDKADDNTGSGIKINADIREIKQVSSSARTWFGALAGRARILVRVAVSDLNSGKQIQAFEVEGVSGESARAGTTDEAIQRAAQLIVVEMVKISRLTSQ